MLTLPASSSRGQQATGARGAWHLLFPPNPCFSFRDLPSCLSKQAEGSNLSTTALQAAQCRNVTSTAAQLWPTAISTASHTAQQLCPHMVPACPADKAKSRPHPTQCSSKDSPAQLSMLKHQRWATKQEFRSNNNSNNPLSCRKVLTKLSTRTLLQLASGGKANRSATLHGSQGRGQGETSPAESSSRR